MSLLHTDLGTFAQVLPSALALSIHCEAARARRYSSGNLCLVAEFACGTGTMLLLATAATPAPVHMSAAVKRLDVLLHARRHVPAEPGWYFGGGFRLFRWQALSAAASRCFRRQHEDQVCWQDDRRQRVVSGQHGNVCARKGRAAVRVCGLCWHITVRTVAR